MSTHFECQCFVCGQPISRRAQDAHPLDPCAVTIASNTDKTWHDQREQTFFCHFACFQTITQDPSIIYLPGIPTNRESEEETITAQNAMDTFSQLLYDKGHEHHLWQKLCQHPRGKWIHVSRIIDTHANEIETMLQRLENDVFFEQLVVTWIDDAFAHHRGMKNPIVVMIATESHYEFVTSLLVNIGE